MRPTGKKSAHTKVQMKWFLYNCRYDFCWFAMHMIYYLCLCLYWQERNHGWKIKIIIVWMGQPAPVLARDGLKSSTTGKTQGRNEKSLICRWCVVCSCRDSAGFSLSEGDCFWSPLVLDLLGSIWWLQTGLWCLMHAGIRHMISRASSESIVLDRTNLYRCTVFWPRYRCNY